MILYFNFGEITLRIITQFDVFWQKDVIIRALELNEPTTSIYSGILRNDTKLLALQSNFDITLLLEV